MSDLTVRLSAAAPSLVARFDIAQPTLRVNVVGVGSLANTLAAAEWVIDGGGVAITTGIKGDLVIPFACNIEAATMVSTLVGSIIVDIWKDTYANFPPTVADKITGATPPTIAADDQSTDVTLTGWTVAIAAGSILRFNVNSVTGIQRVTLSLLLRRT